MDQLDSEKIRWILAAAGVIVILAVYIWGRHKSKLLDFVNQRGEYDELDLGERRPQAPPQPARTGGGIAAAKGKAAPPPDDFDPSPSLGSLDELDDNEYFSMAPEAEARQQPAATPVETQRTSPLGAPFLIQISVVASDEEYFDGMELRDALEDLRLIHGDMGIYHRYDRDLRTPLFSVASLVEPGTFPVNDMANFYCPGVVLFFQPPQVDDPVAVFDDLVATGHELAMRLNGMEWDEKRQPLSYEKIAVMRSRLKEVY